MDELLSTFNDKNNIMILVRKNKAVKSVQADAGVNEAGKVSNDKIAVVRDQTSRPPGGQGY